ncbi:hypothetical protein [Bradyrhizobium jicamae]|uniref:hypothetical protein n=1 Tax=Bradyrhizobium jicamae TaxID=280332 RepID=UPI0012EE3F10|nr:hypothetical protein [Bradyrhizobium jicamae]
MTLQYAWRRRDPLPLHQGYKIPVQYSWPSGAIEQHGDAGGTVTDVDNDASPVSQLWAAIGSERAHLEAPADNHSVGFLNHHQSIQLMKGIVCADAQDKSVIRVTLRRACGAEG